MLIRYHCSSATLGSVLPYISLSNETEGVITQVVPPLDDGCSPYIEVPNMFPLGKFSHFKTYVHIYISIFFSESLGFLFNIFENVPIVAPYLTDIDISYGVGSISYEVHSTNTSMSLLTKVNSLIEEHMETHFSGKWMLVAEWKDVPQYSEPTNYVGLLIC